MSTEFAAVLEVARQPDEALLERLIVAAYEASRHAPVLLALENISRAEVDKILDHCVNSLELSRPGIQYADAEDDATVLLAAMTAHRIFASSEKFRAKLDARGLAYHDVADWERVVAALAALATTSRRYRELSGAPEKPSRLLAAR